MLKYAKSGFKAKVPADETLIVSHRKLPTIALIAAACAVGSGIAYGLVARNADGLGAPVSSGSSDEAIRLAEALHARAMAAETGIDTDVALVSPVGGDAPRVDGALSAPDAKAAAASPDAPLNLVAPVTLKTVERTDRVRPGETLSHALGRYGVAGDTVNALVAALKGTLDMRSIRPGDAYALIEKNVSAASESSTTVSALDVFEYRPKNSMAPIVIRATKAESGAFTVEKIETPLTTKVAAITGTITSSLYDSMHDSGEGIQLVNNFVDVFAWNIDFYRDTQKNDKYKVIVEKQYAEGRFVGYGKVLAAEYVNAGRVQRGFNFKSKDGKVQGVFDDKGESLERTFLKSPLEVTRVTSRFGQRFHPVLKSWRQHKGIDYGAPRGTPFWAVADGVVEEARFSSSAGNMIVIRHANGYTTEYFHANAFASGIRAGAKVKQRQVVGYVGNTGRSTGPHLHFGLLRAGGHVDPGKQKFPSAKPVPSTYIEEYAAAIAAFRAELESLEMS